jgi:hypothetical protein
VKPDFALNVASIMLYAMPMANEAMINTKSSRDMRVKRVVTIMVKTYQLRCFASMEADIPHGIGE